MKYRLLVGLHTENDPTGKHAPDGRPLEVTYKADDVFESQSNLLRFNCPGMQAKFERVDDAASPAPITLEEAARRGFADDPALSERVRKTIAEFDRTVKTVAADPTSTLDSMNVEELRKEAAAEGIALSGKETKEQLVAMVVGAE